jgi:MFS family permease
MIVIRPISGRLFDNYGHKIIILPAILSGIIGLILLAFTSNTPTLLLAGICYGVAYGTVTPSLQAIAVSSVSRDKHGTANAMFFSAMDLGVAIGSTGLGLLASATSYRFIYGFSVVPLIALIIAYSFIYLKKRQPEAVSEQA